MGVAPEVPACFEREQGFTVAEWQRCLPGAVHDRTLAYTGPGQAVVAVGAGTLALSWTVLPPRRIALISMPRLAVRYRFDGVDAETRREFMRYFDLYTRRGGG